MKFLVVFLLLASYFILHPSLSLAQATPTSTNCQDPANKTKIECIFGTIQPPDPVKTFIGTDKTGSAGISSFLSAAIVLIYTIAAVVFVFMLLWGALQWIFSGGDKGAVEGARNRILHALIGLAVLAVAFALVTVAGQFVGINILGNLPIPTPKNPTPSLPAP